MRRTGGTEVWEGNLSFRVHDLDPRAGTYRSQIGIETG